MFSQIILNYSRLYINCVPLRSLVYIRYTLPSILSWQNFRHCPDWSVWKFGFCKLPLHFHSSQQTGGRRSSTSFFFHPILPQLMSVNHVASLPSLDHATQSGLRHYWAVFLAGWCAHRQPHHVALTCSPDSRNAHVPKSYFIWHKMSHSSNVQPHRTILVQLTVQCVYHVNFYLPRYFYQ